MLCQEAVENTDIVIRENQVSGEMLPTEVMVRHSTCVYVVAKVQALLTLEITQ